MNDKINPANAGDPINEEQKKMVKKAHELADKDISKDPDFVPDENADLDEGELTRKGRSN